MQQRRLKILLPYSICILLLLNVLSACSNKKNTAVTRTYHSINTRYNIHFNAQESYNEALKSKLEEGDKNLSEMLYIYPYDPDIADKLLTSNDSIDSSYKDEPKSENMFSSAVSSFLGGSEGGSSGDTFNPFGSTNSSGGSKLSGGGSFTTTVDKCTKAIKLHSIKTKPRRDRSKSKDEKYKAWTQQKEFNPFLKNVWLLLGKAELQNQNYLQSVSTFMYTSKIYNDPEILAESQLWIARNYTEMGWMYEAANVLHNIDINGGVPDKFKSLYASVYANYLMRNNEPEKAIPHMAQAIKGEKNKTQKLRMKYILGQLYAQSGDRAAAYKAFGDVQGINTPHKYGINARISQLAQDDQKTKKEVIGKLNKLTKGSRNRDYLDKVFYTIANVYMQELDTVNAIKNYRMAIDTSTLNGYDKTLAQITLGDIYFKQREYVHAQPCYSGALAMLKKTDKSYPHVALRSAVLDELVVHVKVVHEQDSLQHLALLPEAERMEIINDKIEQLKREEKQQQKEEERQQQMAARENNISSWADLGKEISFDELNSQKPQTSGVGFTPGDNSGAFYFYNPQTVTQGKQSFQKQWGNRKLEDDWRRRNKTSSGFGNSFDAEEELLAENDSIRQNESPENSQIENLLGQEGATEGSAGADTYSPEYYLQQLPLTADKMQQSNELVENALFNMGGIYKNKLEDLYLSIEAFESDLKRFPETPNKQEIYYQLFLIYLQLERRDLMALYRDRLLTEFPNEKYAITLTDPDYEWNLRHMHALQDSLYDATYEAYLDSDIRTVRANYESLQQKYPFSNLMSKFMLLNALTYAQTREVQGLQSNLETLVKEYPNEDDVVTLANDILSHIKEGKILLSDGTPIRGMKWNIELDGEGGSIVDEKELLFADNPDSEHMILLFYKSNTIDRNELLYQVADYNFSNYLIQTYDLSFEQDPPLEMLQIKGFQKFSNIRSYTRKAFEADGLVHRIDPSILMIPISIENSKLLLVKGLDEYITFFKEHYADQTPQLITYWAGGRPIVEEYEELASVDVVETKEKADGNKAEVPKKEDEPTTDININPDDITLEIKNPVDRKLSETGNLDIKKGIDVDTSINASDVMSQGQIDAVQTAGDVLNNPVDGIKGLFSKYKNKEKLTKEEKEELKEERRIEKIRQKEIKAIERARQDSISRVEKAIQDSIKQVERERVEEQKRIEQEKERIEQEKKDAIKAKAKAKDDARKQKEQDRKNKKEEQDRRRKEQEQDRNEKRQEQEKVRNEKRKEQEQLRKEREREAQNRRNRK